MRPGGEERLESSSGSRGRLSRARERAILGPFQDQEEDNVIEYISSFSDHHHGAFYRGTRYSSSSCPVDHSAPSFNRITKYKELKRETGNDTRSLNFFLLSVRESLVLIRNRMAYLDFFIFHWYVAKFTSLKN
ncbi:Protein of unknown function [Cotesia congregata]|uniref:Uncharacterized protein n=1 Tax=Cotesia congregata TaxID=51543 RepID=A0A8J2MQM5_COTCN|nr:Protein of unknown function [Cotesia congregata]